MPTSHTWANVALRLLPRCTKTTCLESVTKETHQVSVPSGGRILEPHTCGQIKDIGRFSIRHERPFSSQLERNTVRFSAARCQTLSLRSSSSQSPLSRQTRKKWCEKDQKPAINDSASLAKRSLSLPAIKKKPPTQETTNSCATRYKMCQYALYSYPCGHSQLLLIQECETRRQNTQLACQLDETLPDIPITATKITYHHLDEGTPLAADIVAAATDREKDLMSCKTPSCHAGFSFDAAMRVASRLSMAIQTTTTTYETLHSKWLTAHYALRKFQMLATPEYLAARPRLKKRLEKHKEWARVLVGVEKRLGEAERVLYMSVGDVEGLKRAVVMSKEWKGVVRGLHHARVGLGMLRWEIEGNECW